MTLDHFYHRIPIMSTASIYISASSLCILPLRSFQKISITLNKINLVKQHNEIISLEYNQHLSKFRQFFMFFLREMALKNQLLLLYSRALLIGVHRKSRLIHRLGILIILGSFTYDNNVVIIIFVFHYFYFYYNLKFSFKFK